MRDNQPVNNNQKFFKEGSTLISITDLNGVIEYVNNDFLEISGFTLEELIGQNHHIIRHPDMPEAAFADLWRTIKAGNEWRGMVKNRCKDGGYYWVDAYVISVLKNGKVIGYQSMRSVPTKEQVEKAETLYKKMRQDKSLTIVKKVRWVDIDVAKKTSVGIAIIFLLMISLISIIIQDNQQQTTILNEQISLLKYLPDQQYQYNKLQKYNDEMQQNKYSVYLLISLISFAIIYCANLVKSSLIKPISELKKQLRNMSGEISHI